MKHIKIFFKILTIAWLCEFAIMMVIGLLPPMSDFVESVVDSTSLAIIMIFPVWRFVIIPILKNYKQSDMLFTKAANEFQIVCIYDLDGKIQYVSDPFCKISQYSREELLGLTINFFNSTKNGNKPKIFKKAVESGLIWSGELVLTTKAETEVWLKSDFFPVKNESGMIEKYCSVSTDITDIKNLQEAEKHNTNSLMQAAKMAELGEIAASVAHEINNPLTVILNRASISQSKISKQEADFEFCKTQFISIEHSAEKIEQIVKTIKNYSRAEKEEEPFVVKPVIDIINDALSNFNIRIHGKNFELKQTVIPDNLICIKCRPNQIHQVILNLLNNGFDAVQELNEKWVQIEVKQTRVEVEVRIIDSGKGIPEDIQKKMMDAFFTTKPVGIGTGLGLSVSKKIMDAHAATLSIDNTSPNTCFVLKFRKADCKQIAG